MRHVPTILLLLGLAGACVAQPAPAPQNVPQDAKPAGAQAPAQGKEKAKPTPDAQPPVGNQADQNPADQEPPPQPKVKLPPRSSVFAEIGYGDWGLDGSHNRFRQYATIPTGFFIRDLRFSPQFKTPSEYAFLDLKGLVEDDYRGEGRMTWNYGGTRAAGFFSRFRFFDPIPTPVDSSSRVVDGFNVQQALARNFGVSFRYRDDTQRNNYFVPFANLDQDTQYWDAVASGKLGREYARLNYSNLHFSDHTGTLVNSTTQTVGLSYLWNLSNAADLEAAYAHVAISEPGVPQSHLDIMSLTGDFALGPATDLDFRLQQRNLGLPGVQSAFVRAQGLGAVNLYHRWKSWRAQVGLRLHNDERVNGTQTFVDIPKWSTLEGRLSGKLLQDLRVTVRGYTQTLFNPPTAITEDMASLYWNSRNFVQASLEGGSPEFNYYAVYTYQGDRNSARSTEVKTTQYTVGGIWQISPTVNLFGEYHHESWSGHTDFDMLLALRNFLPNSNTGIVELTWNLPRLFLSLSYTGFSEHNDNPLLLPDGNAHGSFLTLSGRYRFPRGYELGLTVAPWSYHDNVVGSLDYNAAVVMVTGSARF